MVNYVKKLSRKYSRMSDCERIIEMNNVTRKRIDPLAMLAVIVLILRARS